MTSGAIDLQLGPEADALAEQEPGRVRTRLQKVLAPHDFELEWVSVYRLIAAASTASCMTG